MIDFFKKLKDKLGVGATATVGHINKRWVYYVAALIVVTILSFFGIQVDKPEVPDEPIFNSTGWNRDDQAVEDVKRTLEFPEFGFTPVGRAVLGDEPDHVYLWKAWDAIGKPYSPANQGGVGSCVGFGTTWSAATSSAVAAASNPNLLANPPPLIYAEEVTYGGSRVEIGGGRIRGDGSVGAWAADWCKNFGMVPRGTYGRWNLERYSESLCRELGRNGIPPELEEVARKFPIKEISQARTVQDVYRAHANGWAVMICSNIGFGNAGSTQGRRDSQGFIRPANTWAHCMFSMGYEKRNRPGFYIMNSWGANWVSGPKGPGDPPEGGFWIDESVMQRILDQKDSWVLSDVKGFAPRPIDKLDWFVRAHGRIDRFANNNLLGGQASHPAASQPLP